MQNFYAPHKFQRNSKIAFPGGKEMSELKPSVEAVRNLVAYAAALLIVDTRSLGNVAVVLN